MNKPASGASPRRAIDVVNASLERRYKAEQRFRRFGALGVILGLSFVAILFVNIVSKGYTAFWQTYLLVPVDFVQSQIDPQGQLALDDLDKAGREEALQRVNFLKLARDGFSTEFPDVQGRTEKRELYSLLSPGAPLQLRDVLVKDPGLVGQRQDVWLVADDDVDMYMKGRSTPIEEIIGNAALNLSVADSGLAVLTASEPVFRPAVEIVQRHLSREANKLEPRLNRVEAQLESARADRDAAVSSGDAERLAKAELEVAKVQQRYDQLSKEIAELRAGAAAGNAGEETLNPSTPSFLVAFDQGGIIKATLVSPTRLEGEIISRLSVSDTAEAGSWRLLELMVPQADRRLSDQQIAWIWQLEQAGAIEKRFNTLFFTNGTSREPELAGIAAAVMGSFYTLLLTLLFSFPIGVGAAIYLEEFAPKNRITDIIEVNINNLAAVPSIVFGLLGLAVFINFFGVPRSTPLVAALVLTLMTLPTIIIASRAALKSVPPSIREAALGVGASPLQTQFHHVLPLAMPGMLTGTIIGMAQALGEAAPLLMIGLIAFIVSVPGGVTDPATVLPVQIFMWADSPERGFVERTSAGIMVLLAFLILMNLAAVLLRRRFERRW